MADRMDIDALLIGSLYGELTPADQARLQTHLESHPADRSVLADLTHARQVIRESRLFELQFEPPQAVSALLLQEAARRAPRVRITKPNAERGESWFQRFLRSLASHPAMAAAAMLVVVLGAAAIMYKRNGAQSWEPNAEQAAPAATAPVAPPEGKAQKDDYRVDLANEEKLQQARVQSQTQTVDAGALAAPSSVDSPVEPAAQPPSVAADPTPRKQPPRGIEVEGARPEPKDLVDDDAKAKTGFRGNKESQDSESRLDAKRPSPSPSPSGPGRVVGSAPGAPHTGGAGSANDGFGVNGDTTTGTTAGSTGAGGGGAGATAPANRKLETAKDARRPTAPAPTPATTPAPAPAPPPPPAPAQQAPSREKTVQKGAGDKNDAEKPADKQSAENLAYARDQHQKIIAAVKANRCMEATNLALNLQTRAPAYYAQNVENDRAIKTCASYIANERAKRVEAEKRARANASERRVDEAPKATAPTSTNK